MSPPSCPVQKDPDPLSDDNLPVYSGCFKIKKLTKSSYILFRNCPDAQRGILSILTSFQKENISNPSKKADVLSPRREFQSMTSNPSENGSEIKNKKSIKRRRRHFSNLWCNQVKITNTTHVTNRNWRQIRLKSEKKRKHSKHYSSQVQKKIN